MVQRKDVFVTLLVAHLYFCVLPFGPNQAWKDDMLLRNKNSPPKSWTCHAGAGCVPLRVTEDGLPKGPPGEGKTSFKRPVMKKGPGRAQA